ncbi:hypothetical protein ANANG_G00016820 [Anguilla anguilla]|uniref:Uncharacterized protein n=1 Tax=Anguilla anguilla TaxID=7936 RepID=A0A9D3MYF7_ANGAN|nr:hypothetical protein ANANG_G00016820 [Anguilla anguilla]
MLRLVWSSTSPDTPRNSPAHYPPLAACYSSHQIQNIGSSIPGSQGISPSIPSKDIQTLHASQIPPFCYLRTPSTSPSSHLHFQNTPSIPPQDIQTLHASQIPPFCYLRTPGTSPSSHLHFQNTSPVCSGPTMVE